MPTDPAATEPEQEAAFLDFYLTSRLAVALNLRFGFARAATRHPGDGAHRLVNALLKYPSQPSGNITGNGIYTKFPFLPTPHDGRDRVHMDCAQMTASCGETARFQSVS